MEPFFAFHPGADIGQSLFKERDWWIGKIIDHPRGTIDLLAEKYKFGCKSDFWDDYIFLLVIAPALVKICEMSDLRSAVNLYSDLDHSLFRSYIRRDEDPVRFRRAFWNVNSYGKYLADRIGQAFCHSHKINSLVRRSNDTSSSSRDKCYKIAFIFKSVLYFRDKL